MEELSPRFNAECRIDQPKFGLCDQLIQLLDDGELLLCCPLPRPKVVLQAGGDDHCQQGGGDPH
jgi:hypothetical protein